MSDIRRKTAEHLSHAWTSIPHVTQHDKADITALEELRKTLRDAGREGRRQADGHRDRAEGRRRGARRFPQFNASIDMARDEIVYKKYVNIGVAVDTERGLLVPVIRDVDQKNIIAARRRAGASSSEKARAGKLSLDEMQGGCFTITNLGGIGGTSFTPIVNSPEVAILGISRGAHRAGLRTARAFVPRLMLPLSLSYDHRVIDGADGIRFLRWVVEALEQPFVLCTVTSAGESASRALTD